MGAQAVAQRGPLGVEQERLIVEIRIPQASMEMTEGAIDEWLVGNGSTVEAGDPIYSLETDKVVMEIVSPAAGTIRIIGEPGVTYQVGHVIGHVE